MSLPRSKSFQAREDVAAARAVPKKVLPTQRKLIIAGFSPNKRGFTQQFVNYALYWRCSYLRAGQGAGCLSKVTKLGISREVIKRSLCARTQIPVYWLCLTIARKRDQHIVFSAEAACSPQWQSSDGLPGPAALCSLFAGVLPIRSAMSVQT